MLDGEDIEMGDFDITNNTPTRFPVEIKRQTKGGIDNSRNQNARLEDQRMHNYTLGGNHLFGKIKVDWMGSYAKASEERLDERYAEFESEYQIYNDITDPYFPIFTPVNPSDADNLSNFEYGEITAENQYTEEDDVNVFANAQFPSDWFGKGEGFIKAGVRGRFKNKSRDNNFFEYDLEDMYPTMADVPTKDVSDSDYYAGSQYLAGYFADEVWLGQLELTNGEDAPGEYLRDNFEVTENVFAGYVMTNQQLSEKFSVLACIRLEATDIEATGNLIIDEEDLQGVITETSSYTNVLPSVHLKYDFGKNSILRFAWTNTLARPNYVDLTPYLDIVEGDEEIFLGNPELDPTTSMNFDLMYEHYYENVGILSAGAFYKAIKDFTYVFQYETDGTEFGPGTDGFDVFEPLNGDSASVFGIEFAYQRQLDFLPSFLKNLSIYANYTFLTSDATGIRNEDGDERDDIDLPNTAPNMFNGSLGYATDRFSARISANFSDSYIDEVGGNEFEDRYYDQQLFLDFNASFSITEQLRIYADWTNITNQELRYFQSVKERTQQAEYYGSRIAIGLKYDLFKK